jgi:AcrR family transcriptional regulator
MTGPTVDTDGPGETAPGRPRDPRIEDAILEAARGLLVEDGYSRLSLSGVAARAGSNRPALYRRWRNKLELVTDALRYGYRRERAYLADSEQCAGSPYERFVRMLRALDPRVVNPQAYVLQGDVLAESERNPLLLEALQEHAVEPRCADFAAELRALQQAGAIRADVDVEIITTLCFGGFFGAFLRGGVESADQFAGAVAPPLWKLLATSDQ